MIGPPRFHFVFLLFMISTGCMWAVWATMLAPGFLKQLFSAPSVLVKLFAVLWLCLCVAFGVVLTALAVFALFLVFGTEKISMNSHDTSYTRNLFGLHYRQRFAIDQVSGFGLPAPRSGRFGDRKSTRLNSSHTRLSRMPSSA